VGKGITGNIHRPRGAADDLGAVDNGHTSVLKSASRSVAPLRDDVRLPGSQRLYHRPIEEQTGFDRVSRRLLHVDAHVEVAVVERPRSR
jgi:hypothetical protein